MTTRVSRRAFLGAGVAAAGAAAVTAGWWRVVGSPSSPPPVAQGSVTPMRFFADPEAARRVGEAYLELAPEDADTDLLDDALGVRDGTIDAAGVRGRARADFDQGDVVDIDGWYLSRSEARLCALVALTGNW